MQGFTSFTRAQTYRCHLKAGATYTLQNFYPAKSKDIYRVSDQSLTFSFSNGYVLSPLDDITVYVSFPQTGSGSTHMRISKLTVDSGVTSMVIYLVQKICVLIYIQISLLIFMNNLVDVIGHLRLVNGLSLLDATSACTIFWYICSLKSMCLLLLWSHPHLLQSLLSRIA